MCGVQWKNISVRAPPTPSTPPFRIFFEITPGRDYVEISKPFRFLNLAKKADYNEEISVITPG